MSEDEQRNVSAEYDGSCEDNKAEALANGASDVIVVGKWVDISAFHFIYTSKTQLLGQMVNSDQQAGMVK